jgi:hypothetical protein
LNWNDLSKEDKDAIMTLRSQAYKFAKALADAFNRVRPELQLHFSIETNLTTNADKPTVVGIVTPEGEVVEGPALLMDDETVKRLGGKIPEE